MNILREVRRLKKKSMPLRILLLFGFSVIFIVTTYAWFSTQKDVHLGGLEGHVTSWDVAYYVKAEEDENESEMLDTVVTFTAEELYPGMPEREDLVHIYNTGTSSTNITYELKTVKVFGQDVLEKIKTDGELKTTIDDSGTTVNLFSKDTQYPFNISYTYDRQKLIGKYVDDASTPSSVGTFKFHVNWAYEKNNQDGTADIARDILDTKFGKQAYAYYKDEDNDPSKAIEITVKITSSFIHPKDDPDHPDYAGNQ